MRDRRPLTHAADHETAIDPFEQCFEVRVLHGIGAHHGVLDPHAHTRGDEAGDCVEARGLVVAERAFLLEIEDEPEPGRVRDLVQAGFEARGVPRIAAGQGHRAGEAMPSQQRRLVERAAERRADARDGPVVVRETCEPREHLLVLREGHVIQECIPAIEEPSQAARGHVAQDLAVLLEVDRAASVRASRQRRHGEHAAQILGPQGRRLHGSTLTLARAPWTLAPRNRWGPSPVSRRGSPRRGC